MDGCAAAEASLPPTIPTAGQALRRWQPHTAAEPVNPRSPLRAGLPSSTAVVLSARRGQRGQGTTSIGRVLLRGEADSWVDGHSPVFL